MKKLFLLFIICLATHVVSAQNDTSNQNIRKLLLISGSDKVAIQMMNNLAETFKKESKDIPTEFWTEFMKEVRSDELVEMIVPIYAKYYTAEEINQLLAFYQTPVGKKVIATLPLISQESYEVGAKWGKVIGERAVQKLKDKGYIKE